MMTSQSVHYIQQKTWYVSKNPFVMHIHAYSGKTLILSRHACSCMTSCNPFSVNANLMNAL